MGEASKIEWTDHTFNPWIGCEKVSPGCKNCYASVDTYARVSASRGLPLWGPGSSRHRTSKANWAKPRAWNRKAARSREVTEHLMRTEGKAATHVRPRVFCASLADVFEGRADLDPWRADLWDLIEKCTELDWLLLTKRPENVLGMVPQHWHTAPAVHEAGLLGSNIARWPSHVWLGTSVENQEQAEVRIPHLLAVPAPVRFLSLEPLLGPVRADDIGDGAGGVLKPLVGLHWEPHRGGLTVKKPRGNAIDWLIIGGESGPGARPCDVAWIRDLVRQGREAGVATFVKQLGAHVDDTTGPARFTDLVLRHPKGGDMAEWPEDLRVRVIPASAAGQDARP